MFDSRPPRAGPISGALAAFLLLAAGGPAAAQRAAPQTVAAPAPPLATYADFAALAEKAAVVAIVEVRDQAVVEAARAGPRPGADAALC